MSDVASISIIDFVVGKRDNGVSGAPFSDWWTECWNQIGRVQGLPDYSNFPFIALFVDESNHMYTCTVQSAYDAFCAKADAARIPVVEFLNPTEAWIEPFIPNGLLAPPWT